MSYRIVCDITYHFNYGEVKTYSHQDPKVGFYRGAHQVHTQNYDSLLDAEAGLVWCEEKAHDHSARVKKEYDNGNASYWFDQDNFRIV